MPNVFDFVDFRAYLKSCYEEKRKRTPSFSYAVFARLAGLKNKAFLFQIVNGEKKLSHVHCYKLSKMLAHTKEEAAYFENIVDFKLAKNDEDREFYYKKAMENKSGTAFPAHMLRKDQYEYLSHWYHTAVRALIGLRPFRDDYAWLSQKLSQAITKTQAKKSVQLLDRLGLIAKGNDGVYRVKENKIKAGDEISQTARNRFLCQYAALARNSIMDHPPETHSISSLTLGISERMFEIIRKEERQYKNKIVELVSSDEKADRVYQYQLMLFPLTDNKLLE
jgi:uncharacterized protein (TIGR02147 family)